MSTTGPLSALEAQALAAAYVAQQLQVATEILLAKAWVRIREDAGIGEYETNITYQGVLSVADAVAAELISSGYEAIVTATVLGRTDQWTIDISWNP